MDFQEKLNMQTQLQSIVSRLKSGQRLLAVSKLQSSEKIVELHQLGQLHFAENYIQEALEKISSLNKYSISWHLIGPIQKNKVKYLKNNFDYIHSINSLELAEMISKKSIEINYIQKVFLQINLSAENTKSGFSAEELITNWPSLKNLLGINIIGLMTMPPLENEPEKNRVYFKNLKKLADQLSLKELSMGTSQDYLIALEEGATWIRVGTQLFGNRKANELK